MKLQITVFFAFKHCVQQLESYVW